RAGHLLHRVAYPRIGLQHHVPPRLAPLSRDLRALPEAEGAPDRGWDRLAARDPLAPGHELARPAKRDAMARAEAERGRPRARPLLDAAARAHRRERRDALRDARGGGRTGQPLLRLRPPALGLRRP